MAQRRMFSKDITENDAFLDMPLSTQALYFHLGMQADDDGFVSPNRIIRMLGAQPDDLKILISKKFVLPFEDGVVVLKHWRMNNFIRKDLYKVTTHGRHRDRLFLRSNGAYSLDSEGAVALPDGHFQVDKLCSVNESSTERQPSIGKDRLDKDIDNTSKKQKYTEEDMGLARFLADCIRENNPHCKKPNIESWAQEIGRMIRLDKRTPEQVRFIIELSQKHTFWRKNILSPKKLRKHFDRLIMEAKEVAEKQQSGGLKLGSIK